MAGSICITKASVENKGLLDEISNLYHFFHQEEDTLMHSDVGAVLQSVQDDEDAEVLCAWKDDLLVGVISFGKRDFFTHTEVSIGNFFCESEASVSEAGYILLHEALTLIEKKWPPTQLRPLIITLVIRDPRYDFVDLYTDVGFKIRSIRAVSGRSRPYANFYEKTVAL